MGVSTQYCRYCGRLLKNKNSIEKGFGEICYKKHIESLRKGGLIKKLNIEKDIESK